MKGENFHTNYSVLISVIVMVGLCLVKVNVLITIILAALTGGVISGMGLNETMSTLLGGMRGNAETALYYILLGVLAYNIGKTGAAELLALKFNSPWGSSWSSYNGKFRCH